MEIILDDYTEKFLKQICMKKSDFCNMIRLNYNKLPMKKVIHDGIKETKVFRLFINKCGYIIVSFTGIEGVLMQYNDILQLYSIPNSIFNGCSISDARKIIDGEPDALIAFGKVIEIVK